MFEYQLIRSRRKSLRIHIARDNRVIVRAPINCSLKMVQEFVFKYRSWIEEKLSLRKNLQISYREGDSVLLFGKPYFIRTGMAKIADGVLYLPENNRDAHFKKLLCELTQTVMGERVERLCKRYGFSYSQMKISSARSFWGTCSKTGVIRFTFRTAFLSMELCEYVALHELCHTRYFNHSKEFWREVEKYMPNWRIYRDKLKASSYLMSVLPF